MNHSENIHRYLRQLKSRLIWLWSLHSLAGLFLCLLVAVVVLSVGLSLKMPLSGTLVVIGCINLCVLSVWLKKSLPKFLKQIQTPNIIKAIETQLPKLNGRTYLIFDKNPNEGFLRTRALTQVWEGIQSKSPEIFVPSTDLVQILKKLSFMGIVFIATELLLPVGPLKALAIVLDHSSVQQQMLSNAIVDEDSEVVIGDIGIHYLFPEYTKMSPITIPNSNGSIHAPMGTEVRIQAKTLDFYDAVSIQINDAEPQMGTLLNGRNIEATFVLQSEGRYRFLLLKGDRLIPSQSFELVFDDDDPPVVTVEIQKNKIPSNRPISLKWNASDDFGLERVLLEIEAHGQVRSILLRKPQEHRLEMQAELKRVAADLGLKGGDKAQLRVVAYDNQVPIESSTDTENSHVTPDENQPFGKRGESASIEIEIMTPEMTAEQMRDLNRKLRDLMLPMLASYLVEALPQPHQMNQWSQKARKRYDPLRTFTQQEWGDLWPNNLSAELVAEVLNDSAKIFRFVSSTYGDASLGTPKDSDYQNFAQMVQDHIAQVERAIFIIDRMLRQVAFMEVAKEAKKMQSQINHFTERDIENMNAEEILAHLNPIQHTLQDLQKAAEDLGDNSLKDFIENRSSEIENLQKELKKSIQAKESDQTRQIAEQLAKAMEQFSDGVNEQLERAQQKEDELQEQMESLIEKLEELEAAQVQMATEIADKRASDGSGVAAMNTWKELERLAIQASQHTREILSEVGDGAGFTSSSITAYERLALYQEDLYNAILIKDVEGAQLIANRLPRYVSKADNRTDTEMGRARMSNDRPAGLSKIRTSTTELEKIDEQILNLLQRSELHESAESEAMMDLAKQQSPKEHQLESEMEAAKQKVAEVEQEMPTADGSASRFAEAGVKVMSDAYQVLKEGDSMKGEGFELQAASHIRSTIEALQEQMQQMQQMQQQVSEMASGQSQDGEQDDSQSHSVDIPPPESRISPEQYRKQLLEGMQGNVPEEFQSLKKRYYEELVAQ